MRSCIISLVVFMIGCALVISGCATPMESLKIVAGTSTKSIEDSRKDALEKVFGYDYGTCYVKTEYVLKAIPRISIYSKNEDMIAVNYNSVNVTPVGVFFTEVDQTHTRVEISSPSPEARAYVAKSVFAGEVQPDTDKLTVEVRQPIAGKY
jgi:hypothetical protein